MYGVLHRYARGGVSGVTLIPIFLGAPTNEDACGWLRRYKPPVETVDVIGQIMDVSVEHAGVYVWQLTTTSSSSTSTPRSAPLQYRLWSPLSTPEPSFFILNSINIHHFSSRIVLYSTRSCFHFFPHFFPHFIFIVSSFTYFFWKKGITFSFLTSHFFTTWLID